jgi:hypothetical protein
VSGYIIVVGNRILFQVHNTAKMLYELKMGDRVPSVHAG